MIVTNLNKQDLRRLYGSTYYQRGRQYYDDNRVADFSWDEDDDTIFALVRGSGRKMYEVDVAFTLHNDVIHVASACSCPLGGDCKHVIAALLHYIDYVQNGHRGSKQRQSNADRFAYWQQMASEKLLQQYTYYHPSSGHTALLYILDQTVEYPGQIFCSTVKSRRLKKGGFGKPSKYDITNYYTHPEWLAPIDYDIIKLLHQMQQHYAVVQFLISGDVGYLVMTKMIASNRCFYADIDHGPLHSGASREGEMTWQEDSDGNQQLHIGVAGDSDNHCVVLATDPISYIDTVSNEFGKLELPLRHNELQLLQQMPPLPPQQLQECGLFFSTVFANRAVPLPVEMDIRPAATSPVPQLLVTKTKTNTGNDCHIARITFYYQPCTCAPAILRTHPDETVLIEQDGVQWQVTADVKAEFEYLQHLYDMGMTPAQEVGVPASSALELLFTATTVTRSAALWKMFFDQIPALQEKGWRITIDEQCTLNFATASAVDFNISDESDSSWFNIGLDIDYNGQKIALLPLLVQWLERGDSNEPLLAKLDDGSWLHCPNELIEPVVGALVELFDGTSLNADGQLKLHRSQAHQLGQLEQHLQEHGDAVQWRGGEQLRQLAHKLRNFTGISAVTPPAGLQATLRNYQSQGLAWLQFLREYQFNGILADDMGLGKTIQTLAHLLLEKEQGRLNAPALIVAPTSVLSNWQREAQRFTPELKLLVLHGSDRQQYFEQLDNYDLIITSYALLNRDQKLHLARPYAAIILDEAQMIKNPQAKVSQVACAIDAPLRLCLTGTPVENHLGELWSLFRFLMPGFLGSQKRFNKLFRKPIEQHNDSERRQELQRRLLPFILRRNKQQVADELPEKTTILCAIELGPAQSKLYETVRSAMSKKVRTLLAQKGLQNSHIEILDALLKLRQVCCDPRLLKINKDVHESAKLERLLAMLETQLEEGRKILLFSQFTSMLTLIEQELKTRKIPYSKLTGRTRKRDEAINRFQNGTVPLFLVSLKAGGVGLNLTAADTVIHYDPWWNPAVENQATDRAHRIGQDKPVFVYKLIATGTVEEKIVAMQEKKQQLADGVYSDTDQNEASKLSGEDLLALLNGE